MKWAGKLKGKAYLRTVVLGFLLLYLISMLLSTYLVKRRFEESFQTEVMSKTNMIRALIKDEADNWIWKADEISSNYKRFLTLCLTRNCNVADGGYLMMSGAIYDAEGKRIARSEPVFGETGYYENEEGELQYPCFAVAEYFTEEERDLLAEYQDRIWQKYKENPSATPDYLIGWRAEKQSNQLLDVWINRVQWEENRYDIQVSGQLPEQYRNYVITEGEKEYRMVQCEREWEWKNPTITETIKTVTMGIEGTGGLMFFPELPDGFSHWKRWQENTYLQDFPETTTDLSPTGAYSSEGDGVYPGKSIHLFDFLAPENFREELNYTLWFYNEEGQMESDTACILKIRAVTHPWLAAINDMKYVYLGGFLLMFGCIIAVSCSMNRTSRQRAALEEMRRDFINVMAHELKTPLSVIRGFAENLKENTVAEKREYYLDSIIDQTENMDDLVQKMCQVSKLDSDRLVLQKEPVNILELIRKQTERFQFRIAEKNLEIRYDAPESLEWTGDRYYLDKVFSNLISNAVEYNCQDGWIKITLESGKCIIENTGTAIPTEALPHVTDMFYTGNDNSAAAEKHLGLGLYLANRIITLHQWRLIVENTENGVRVVIFS